MDMNPAFVDKPLGTLTAKDTFRLNSGAICQVCDVALVPGATLPVGGVAYVELVSGIVRVGAATDVVPTVLYHGELG